MTAADSGALLASLQGLLSWRIHKLLVGIYSGEPEAVLVGEVMAGALGSVALDEWCCAEILQAGARRDQGLTTTLSAGCRVLQRTDLQVLDVVKMSFNAVVSIFKTTDFSYLKSRVP